MLEAHCVLLQRCFQTDAKLVTISETLVSKHSKLIAFAEYGYAVKYAELNGRNSEPWSLRQLGVYHQWDVETSKSVLVLLLPGSPFESRLVEQIRRDLSATNGFSEVFHGVNEAVLSSCLCNWTDYMCFYETNLQQLVRNSWPAVQASHTLHLLTSIS